MIKLYQIEIVPRLLEEIQESYLETSATIASSIHSSIEMLATKVIAFSVSRNMNYDAAKKGLKERHNT
jgi:hypothetical protein